MKKNYVLAFTAGGLFLVAAVLNYVNGGSARGSICLIAALAFFLGGYHWRRRGRS